MQAALVLSALARVQHRNESFLRRFTVKFVPSLLQEADLLHLCGIVSSLSQLGAYCEETFNLAAQRARGAVSQMDVRQLSLFLNAYVRSGHQDPELFRSLLKQVPRRMGRSAMSSSGAEAARDAAVLLNAIAQLTPGRRPKDAEEDEERGRLSHAELSRAVGAVALRLPDMLPEADLHSLTLTLNAFAQLQYVQKDVLDLLSEELLSNDDRLTRMSPRQLAMILNAAAKLQLYEPRLLDALVARTRLRAPALDAQALCVIANASAKLHFGVETFQVLYAQVPRLLPALSGRQLAMLCHAWAKAHVHNDDLFEFLALPLARKAPSLTAHEVALSVYAYAHFRRSPEELFEPLLQRLKTLEADGLVSDGDLLMLANALGRVGWRDEVVATALKAYASREPECKNVSAQAAATFELTGAYSDVPG